MKMQGLKQRRLLLTASAIASAGASIGLPNLVHAQNAVWPGKTVKLVVAFAPGGPADIIARLLSQRLSDRLKVPVVVENRVGAGGNIAAQAVSRSDADGYTLLVTTSAFTVNPSLSSNAGYDPVKDFAPINIVAATPNIIVAAPTLDVKNLKDVFKLSKTMNMSYGTAGAGTTPHLCAEYLFKSLAKVDIVHAPFAGAAPALNSLMGSQIQLASVALAGAVPLVKAGKVKALGITSPKRISSLPDIATVAEQGYPGFDFATWVGVLAPNKTPASVIERLNSELNLILFIPEVQQQLDTAGFGVLGGTAEKAAQYIKAELQKYAKVVKEAGITAS